MVSHARRIGECVVAYPVIRIAVLDLKHVGLGVRKPVGLGHFQYMQV